jgi:hypothetical protein
VDDDYAPPASLTITVDRDRVPVFEFGIHTGQLVDLDVARDLADSLPRLVAMADHIVAKRAERTEP